jgi:CelD/BcsL family acetyltransferase involved in cellulose biosynthesis
MLLDLQDERWVALLTRAPQANIFHHPAWSDLLAQSYGYRPFVVAVADAAGRITAGLPMMEIRSALTGRRQVALPFTDHCSPLYVDEVALQQLTAELVGLSETAGAPPMTVRAALPGLPSYAHYVLHTLRLSADPEEVAGRLHSTCRRNIQVAKKRGVRIERSDSLQGLAQFYRLHQRTRRRQGVPVQPWGFFARLGRDLLQRGLGFILLAYAGETCIAGAVFLHWGRTLTYKYGASAEEYLSLRPNNLLFWSAIQWACEHGFAVLDFGRTDLEQAGLRTFKASWGAEEQRLYYTNLSGAPPARAPALSKALRVLIRNSPLWLGRIVGQGLYRHFG